MDKILTIIIPTYNMEKYLRHCLDSLVVSGMEKLEVLVINDGSKDSSSVIAHEYQEKYPQTFQVIDKENGNYGSCINRGLKVATGKYVKILDADDSYDSEGLSTFISTLESINVDAVFSDFVYVNLNDEITNRCNLKENDAAFQEDKVFDFVEFVRQDPNKHWSMHAVAYNRKVFNRFTYHQLEGVSYTDTQFVFMPFLYVRNAYYFPHVVYRYLLGREGQTMDATDNIKHIDQYASVIVDMCKYYDKISAGHPLYDWATNYVSNRMGIAYRPLLQRQIDRKLHDSIIDMDKQLQLLPSSRKIADNISVSYHYIKYVKIWRGNDYNLPIWIIWAYKLFRFYWKIRG